MKPNYPLLSLLCLGLSVPLWIYLSHRRSASLLAGLRSAYAEHPWISVLDSPDQGLGLTHVVGSHQAVLAVGPVERSGLIPVFASIDNLMRGAASQALHNLNLWLGLDAGLGLPPPFASLPSGVAPAFATRTRVL